MPRGRAPVEYHRNPDIDKPVEEIYRDIDEWSYEVFEDEAGLHGGVDFSVLLPPVRHEGRFVKGLFYSRGVDVLVNHIPALPHLFTSIACSMWSSYPWSRSADAYFTCYRNPDREDWFRARHPERAGKALVPFQDADFTNEKVFAPALDSGLGKDIDVLCISRLSDEKNLPIVAEALRLYRSRYPNPCIRMTLIMGNKNWVGRGRLGEHARSQLVAMDKVLGRAEDYIDFVGHAEHWSEMKKYYSRAKVFVLGSLIEGKNRCIHEALSCDVPVVCFRNYNQYARNGAPILPEDGGLYSAFGPAALAETIHTVLNNREAFSPRAGYLRENGRENTLNRCMEAIPYYRNAVPDYIPGCCLQNDWLDSGLRRNYQMAPDDFVYRNGRGWAHATGVEQIRKLVSSYSERLQL
jgi:glycosyltransferase involved in cell wall biosynthesis